MIKLRSCQKELVSLYNLFSFIDTPILQNYHGKQAARKEGS